MRPSETYRGFRRNFARLVGIPFRLLKMSGFVSKPEIDRVYLKINDRKAELDAVGTAAVEDALFPPQLSADDMRSLMAPPATRRNEVLTNNVEPEPGSKPLSLKSLLDKIEFVPKGEEAVDVGTSVHKAIEESQTGFRVGTEVTWTSSNVTKVGAITHVIPAGQLPRDVGAKVKDATTPRDHESYVVRGHSTDGRVQGATCTYWPRVSLLKKRFPTEGEKLF